MTRLRADLVLLLVAVIWGAAFVAQKSAEQHIGSFTFVGVRFLLGAFIILPLAWRENKRNPIRKYKKSGRRILFLCAAFVCGVVMQQCAIAEASVARAGFLTGLYVLFVPLVHRLFFREKISPWIYPAALLSVIGVAMLSGGLAILDGGVGTPDMLLLGCAVAFGFQVVLTGILVMDTRAPLQLSFVQYAAVGGLSLVVALITEKPAMADIWAASWPLLYAGVISSAFAYTLQAVAQQHAPPSDSAVILSGESVFAAVAGWWLLGEGMTPLAMAGGGVILLAILLVELGPRMKFKSKF